MKIDEGLWIGDRNAVIVILDEKGEETKPYVFKVEGANHGFF